MIPLIVDSPNVRPTGRKDDNVLRPASGTLGATVPLVRDGDKAVTPTALNVGLHRRLLNIFYSFVIIFKWLSFLCLPRPAEGEAPPKRGLGPAGIQRKFGWASARVFLFFL